MRKYRRFEENPEERSCAAADFDPHNSPGADFFRRELATALRRQFSVRVTALHKPSRIRHAKTGVSCRFRVRFPAKPGLPLFDVFLVRHKLLNQKWDSRDRGMRVRVRGTPIRDEFLFGRHRRFLST
jgi:hypothetical protein